MDDCGRQIRELFEALNFAAGKHRNQRRKDRDSSPYINHPIAICGTLCGCCSSCWRSLTTRPSRRKRGRIFR